MASRHFSSKAYWENRCNGFTPKFSFQGQTPKEWTVWNKTARKALLSCLGPFPQKVLLSAETEYSVKDGPVIRERVIFDSEEFASIPAIVLRPTNPSPEKSLPAILCCHAHGSFGKDTVAGLRSTPEHVSEIDRMNYDYALQMAKAGFFTLAPDLRGFGERRDKQDISPTRDNCDVNYVKGSILGAFPLTLNIHDMMVCIDYLETRPEVHPEKIGMMGLSQGGAVTAFTAALDNRIKAADIIGYVNPWAGFGLSRGNFCGSQVVPDIYRFLDTHDIAGLIAPRPLLLEMGLYDDCFYFQDLWKGFEGVQRIYRAAGVEAKLESDIGTCGHAFVGKQAFNFFSQNLLSKA
ncbi:MAG: hypothetical protein A2293_01760 [Elusimicrobia bacterium RIFOXYB2_FULL_49_7]|nr:MAG: hypothetical protein A2293_01760 [Elusimicrobia bacterium RIFOXYB2_FULL_49_7]